MKKILSFIGKWLLIFLIASVAIFLLVRMMPTSPVNQWLSSYNLPHTEENIAYVTERMGLDKPLIVQYLSWMGNFLRGDWGYSLVSHLPIKEQFIKRLPYSVSIGVFGILIAAAVSFFLGYRAALKPGGFADRFSSGLAIFSQSVPSFILSVIVIYFFSVQFRVMKFFTGSGAYALITAILITALYQVGSLSRVVSSAFREEMGKSYVRFSVSRGFSKQYVLFHHTWRPVFCRLVSAVIADFAWVFGGSTVLEFAFAIPGISYFLVDSMTASDYTVLQTYILVVVIWMFIVHLVLNVVLNIVDVRRRK